LLDSLLQERRIATMDPARIAEVAVTSATDGAKVTFAELWANQTCVIVFLRRFG